MNIGSDKLAVGAFRLVLVVAAGVLGLVAAYQWVPMTRGLAMAAVAGCAGLWACLRRRQGTGATLATVGETVPSPTLDIGMAMLALSALTDLVLLCLFASSRTTDAIVSPWNAFAWEPFALFFISTALLMAGSRWRSDRVSIAFSAWHVFAACAVSATAYGMGFGFDPFLHRAAEEELVARGFIEPRQLLYAGQYVTVAAIHLLTAIPVRVVDVWLVPLFSAAVLPVAGYLGLRYGWGLSDRDARTWWVAALAQPFSLATFTVPFSWTYVWFLAVLFVLPAAARSREGLASLAFGSAAMAAFHPLLAVPTLVLIVGYAAWTRARGGTAREVAALCVIVATTAVVVPGLFVLYQLGQGIVPDPWASLERIGRFASLFRSPYWDPYPFIPFVLEAIYAFRYWFPMACMAAWIVACAVRLRTDVAIRPYLAFVAGLLGAIFFTSTIFSFRGIIDHEQMEFALRLLTAWYVIPLPLLAVGAAWLYRRFARFRGLVVAGLAVLALHAWYFSYPQYNLKYPFFFAERHHGGRGDGARDRRGRGGQAVSRALEPNDQRGSHTGVSFSNVRGDGRRIGTVVRDPDGRAAVCVLFARRLRRSLTGVIRRVASPHGR
jgi:hypothetical protein